MSYVLDLSDNARQEFRNLDIELQEDVLDELERVLSNARLLHRPPSSDDYYYDFTRHIRGQRHYIFFVFERDDVTRKLNLLQLGHVVKPIDDTM